MRSQAVFASASRTSNTNSSDFGPINQETGALFILDISSVSGTSPTLDVKLQHKDPESGNYIDIPGAVFSQKTSTGTDSLFVYPGVVETSNESVSQTLGETYRAVATIGGTSPDFTFSLSASYL